MMEEQFPEGGVSREAELEAVLGELIDLWDKGDIICDVMMDKEDVDYIDSIFDRAATILDDEQD